MNIKENYKVFISLSTKGYKTKPTKDEWSQMIFQKQELTLDELAEKLSIGYAFSANCTDNDTFHSWEKKKINFRSIQYLAIDLDDCRFDSLDELNESLDLKPSICYTSYNHKIKGNRYRLIYILQDIIEDEKIYIKVHTNLTNRLGLSIEQDKCSEVTVQTMCGTYCSNVGFRMINNNIVYGIDDKLVLCYITYNDIPTGCYINLPLKDPLKKQDVTSISPQERWIQRVNEILNPQIIEQRGNGIKVRSSYNPNKIYFTRMFVIKEAQFLYDYYNLRVSIEELLNKYKEVYDNVEHTPLEDNGQNPFIEYPDDYCEIRRGKYVEYIDKYGKKHNKRFQDGNMRRKHLMENGILRRIITRDSITFDNLLYNLLWEYHNHFFSNGSDKIYKEDIWGICLDVWSKGKKIIDSYKDKFCGHKIWRNGKYEKVDYKVSKKYCLDNNVISSTINNAIKTIKTREFIKRYYDATKSDKENLKMFQEISEGDVSISRQTLYRYKRELGLGNFIGEEIASTKSKLEEDIMRILFPIQGVQKDENGWPIGLRLGLFTIEA